MRAANGTPLASLAYPGLLAGVALFTAVLAYQGVHEVAAALSVAGSGLLVVTLFHLVPMLADAFGWHALLAGEGRPGVRTVILARWVGESVNSLLPVMQLGGNVVKARYLARRGLPGATAGASVVVDVTLLGLTQVVFTVIGLSLLLSRLGGARLMTVAVIGTLAMASLLLAFLVVQRRGVFGVFARLLTRVARGSDLGSLNAGAAALDARVAALYRQRAALLTAGGWHLLSWLVGAGEVWLALHFLGHPIDLQTAVLLESLGQAVRTGAFAVPGALGVQEGGYLLLGSTLGLAPEASLALSLSKRIREVLLGLPGLIAWQLDGSADRVRWTRPVVDGDNR
jgi:putative membrane protein